MSGEVCKLCGYSHYPKFNAAGTVAILDWDKEALERHMADTMKKLLELADKYVTPKAKGE